jgi:hypothetical protein
VILRQFGIPVQKLTTWSVSEMLLDCQRPIYVMAVSELTGVIRISQVCLLKIDSRTSLQTYCIEISKKNMWGEISVCMCLYFLRQGLDM